MKFWEEQPWGKKNRLDFGVKVKVKICISPRREKLTSKAPGVDHTVLPAITPHLPLPRSSPEGATTE